MCKWFPATGEKNRQKKEEANDGDLGSMFRVNSYLYRFNTYETREKKKRKRWKMNEEIDFVV